MITHKLKLVKIIIYQMKKVSTIKLNYQYSKHSKHQNKKMKKLFILISIQSYKV